MIKKSNKLLLLDIFVNIYATDMESSGSLPATVVDLPTPCFLVDLAKAKHNGLKMLEICKEFGIQLRPHTKTHKTIELALIQTGGTKQRIVVSTIREAHFYADNGFDDILYGIPITADKIERCSKLANSHDMHFMFDSSHAINVLSNAPLESGKKWSVFLSVDTGYSREGVLWNSDFAVELVKKLNQVDTIRFKGIYTHEGHAYDCANEEEIKNTGEKTVDRLLYLKKRLQEEGIDCTTVSLGSTPSCSKPSENFSSLTEIHPGNYIFYDYEHYFLSACKIDEIACRVATRVIGHCLNENHLVVDCGFTAIGHDGIAIQDKLPFGFCMFQNNPNLRMARITQELGIVKEADGKLDFNKYPIGTILYIYPWHSCATAAMHPFYYVHEFDSVVAVYTPTRGW